MEVAVERGFECGECGGAGESVGECVSCWEGGGGEGYGVCWRGVGELDFGYGWHLAEDD